MDHKKVTAIELLDEARKAADDYLRFDQSPAAGNRMAEAIARLAERTPLIEWVADDSESCVMCAWPESSAVVLRIGRTVTVCQEHIWRGLLSKLGDHPRDGIGYPAGEHA